MKSETEGTTNASSGRPGIGVLRLAWGIGALSVALAVPAMVLLVLNRSTAGTTVEAVSYAILGGAIVVAFAWVGALVASRRPENPIGWMFLAIAFVLALAGTGGEYATRALVTAPGTLPAGPAVAWFQNWIGFIAFPTLFVLVLVLFPNGTLPSPRWRSFRALMIGTAAVMMAGSILAPTPFENWIRLVSLERENPTGVHALGSLPYLAVQVGYIVSAVALALAGIATVRRLRAATGDEREQMKWVAYGAALFAIAAPFTVIGDVIRLGFWVNYPLVIGFLAIPIAAGFAILKYRLYDIDLVISKTVVIGALAAFITAVYVALVVGVGALVGTSGRPNLFLSVMATAVVGVAFQPVRDRARRLANRLVYGDRVSPYEVLARFGERMEGAYAADEALPQMARTIAEATAATQVFVWLRRGTRLFPAGAYPAEPNRQVGELSLSGEELPRIEGADRALPVRHKGELLGALSLSKSTGDPVTPVEDRLLHHLASQAGLVLRNVGLTEDLKARLEELTASRKRLVAAQDAERRRLERNIHDGAQQQLVAIGIKLRLARTLARRDLDGAEEMLDNLARDTQEALETLRELARGIYPPLLADQGLAVALDAQARKASVPIVVDGAGIGRYQQDVEAAVYFCCLEAVQNVAKYAGANSVVVHLREENGGLGFSVADDGAGFDPDTTPKGSGLTNMADRMAALGGMLEVTSAVGRGTIVEGWIPLGGAPRT